MAILQSLQITQCVCVCRSKVNIILFVSARENREFPEVRISVGESHSANGVNNYQKNEDFLHTMAIVT